MRPTSRLLLALAVGVALGMSCSFTFSDDVTYSCRSDADCGTGGFRCTNGACCKPTGEEVCGDDVDNDCDGKVDGDEGRVIEVCNGRDDDCDNATDEGFDLLTSVTNCGACGNACDVATQRCNAGACERRTELDCGNGVDDDGNGQTDCADPGCAVAPCGPGCLCTGGARLEQLCEDGVDNDQDGKADCADADCDQKACGAGCACLGGVAKETNCADGLDNDRDAGADCTDPACADQFCQAGTTQRCMGTACLCNGGVSVPETGGALCGDGLDNDCDNRVDCRDTQCLGQSCSPDGGAGCACAANLPDGGVSKAERACANLLDDDDDTLVDCADAIDCPDLTPCTATAGGQTLPGACGAGQCLVEFCFDGADNDGDGNVDCADSDCDQKSCTADGGVLADGGFPCRCSMSARREQSCADGLDNDGDGNADCADQTDCPQGTACRRSNGMPGTCQPNRSCN